MKIKSPLTNKNEVRPLCEAGADEFFCGIEPNSWRKRYKDFCINQRSGGANFSKLADLAEAVSVAHKYGTKVHVAVNAFFNLKEQYKIVERIIQDIIGIGADGIIFADPVLISNLKSSLLKGKDIIAGTDAVIFNRAAVEFYKELGATRVVFPRAMIISEMKEVILADKAIEYEAFIIHDLCFFEDGFCTYCKEQAGDIKKEGRGRRNTYFFTASRIPSRGFGGGCRTRFTRQRVAIKNHKLTGRSIPFTFWMKKHIQGCGACAIYDLKRAGVTNLKILDRNLPIEEKVKATVFIKNCQDLLKNTDIPKQEYTEKCKGLFKKTFKAKCGQYDCYYPDANLRVNLR